MLASLIFGLRPEYLIHRFNTLIREFDLAALQSVLAAHKPGDRVQAQLTRDGTETTVTVILGTLTS
ncbi:hypothetical protein EAS64_04125 [Trebonia kvetii]|uniref:PDZ domain-containing protein n=1 Tax=Trebonia kvetii TaxID=2480626 RepID=A0A6P2C8D1_9ACTN|nr:hypothetical protein [Trebonia kvetii]TVZ06586.1 hypothetical protein EAS64_04125 [Trebonia kvetii]